MFFSKIYFPFSSTQTFIFPRLRKEVSFIAKIIIQFPFNKVPKVLNFERNLKLNKSKNKARCAVNSDCEILYYFWMDVYNVAFFALLAFQNRKLMAELLKCFTNSTSHPSFPKKAVNLSPRSYRKLKL